MERYISYSLFTKKGDAGVRRWWDPHDHERHRYWLNVPFVPIVNDLCYPGYITRVHVDPETRNHPLFPMLKRLSERRIMEVIECDYPFQNTEPTFWRLQPLWREDYDVVLCRDIDSLPNTREVQATLAFAASSFLVHSMRTHYGHNDGATRMLAGLCAFRGGIKAYLSGTFDDYYRMALGHWGTDQEALVGYFVDRLGAEFVKHHFLDTCVHYFQDQMQEMLPGHDAGKLAQQVYDDVDLSYVPEEVRRCLDALTAWPGQPVNARGDTGLVLLDQDTDTARAVSDCLRRDPTAREFYQIPGATFDGAIPHLQSSSISDSDPYRGVCAAAVADEEVFAQFRQLPAYTAILEHVSEEQGRQYLAEIRRDAPWLLDPSRVLPNDDLGGPAQATYRDFPAVSPTTLRYLKVLADLVTLFGPLADLRVVEVGAGYGGQARLIRSFFPTARHTIFDLPEPLALAQKYLERSGVVDGVDYVACSTSPDVPVSAGDLFISNYALTECASDWYEACVQPSATRCT